MFSLTYLSVCFYLLLVCCCIDYNYLIFILRTIKKNKSQWQILKTITLKGQSSSKDQTAVNLLTIMTGLIRSLYSLFVVLFLSAATVVIAIRGFS